MSELLRETLQQLGVDEHSLHSLRSSGATITVEAGIPDRVFKMHGCWMSDKANMTAHALTTLETLFFSVYLIHAVLPPENILTSS